MSGENKADPIKGTDADGGADEKEDIGKKGAKKSRFKCPP
jgi:hypothetical protein